MNRLKTYLFSLTVLIVICVSCKKDIKEEGPPINKCAIYTNISSDTNYIPHKINNHWSYCWDGNSSVGFNASIIKDTSCQNKIYFDRLFLTANSHSPPQSIPGKSIIDSLGNYHLVFNAYLNTDTILIIKSNALNGDTIYNNLATHNKVVLINANETFRTISGCYHSRVINLVSNEIEDHYYKKGIGEVYFIRSTSSYGYVLDNALIH